MPPLPVGVIHKRSHFKDPEADATPRFDLYQAAYLDYDFHTQ